MIRINRISRCGLVRRPKPAPPIHSSPGAARRRRGSVPRDLDFRAGSLAESLVCSFVRDAGGFRVGFATDLSSDISIHCLHLFRSEPRHLRPQRRPSPGPFASSRSRTERCLASGVRRNGNKAAAGLFSTEAATRSQPEAALARRLQVEWRPRAGYHGRNLVMNGACECCLQRAVV